MCANRRASVRSAASRWRPRPRHGEVTQAHDAVDVVSRDVGEHGIQRDRLPCVSEMRAMHIVILGQLLPDDVRALPEIRIGVQFIEQDQEIGRSDEAYMHDRIAQCVALALSAPTARLKFPPHGPPYTQDTPL